MKTSVPVEKQGLTLNFLLSLNKKGRGANKGAEQEEGMVLLLQGY